MNSLSWAAWKRYCRWMMILCLILALVFGSAWYAASRQPRWTGLRTQRALARRQLRRSCPARRLCAPRWSGKTTYFPNYCGSGEPSLQGAPEDGQGRQKIT